MTRTFPLVDKFIGIPLTENVSIFVLDFDFDNGLTDKVREGLEELDNANSFVL